MLDNNLLFKANDQISLITAITMTNVTAKKMKLYAGLAKDEEVRDFFANRAEIIGKVNISLRKELDRIGGR